jgi:hydrogenase expression/formation protein HypC
MCIGLPLRVVEAWTGQALAAGRGRSETVDTRLVGPCAAGDWLLVFQGAAREKLHAAHAAEINAALDLLEAGLAGDADAAAADPGFALPSAMSAEQLAALAGHTAPIAAAAHRQPGEHR